MTLLPILASLALALPGPTALAQTPPPPAPTWAFQPDADTVRADSLLDLRSLNEKAAGESGFVRRTPDGAGFALGSGKPVRFWAMGEDVGNTGDKAVMAHKARWLAKRGVNMIRDAAFLEPTADGSKITDVNETKLTQAWEQIAAMKREGIYTTLVLYWAAGPIKMRDSWGVPGHPQDASGLLFFDKAMQAGYKAWLRALFTRPNPETGVPLAREPAVALIELQNEDSLLFWTAQGIKGPPLDELRGLYGDWLTRKYGSLEKANAAWGGQRPPADDFQEK